MPSAATPSRVDQTLTVLLPPVERALGRLCPTMITNALIELIVFAIKQAWASLFGGLLLFAMIATRLVYPDEMPIARYDFLVLYAVLLQAVFLLTKLERPSEALVILIFHLVGTGMELFKTEMGSWVYPEDNVLRIAGVPLFSGFMYAAVGSYFARCARVFAFRWTHYPPIWMTFVLSIGIYANFFSHHFIWDARYVLFAATAALFWRCQVHYRVWRWRHRMPLLLGFLLVSFFIWIAENIATMTQIWLYPNQHAAWQMVSLEKLGSWNLLMIISWVLVTLVHRPKAKDAN
ncbi:MAG: DUF817 domain-containing protein [Pseudomonadota bacterium]